MTSLLKGARARGPVPCTLGPESRLNKIVCRQHVLCSILSSTPGLLLISLMLFAGQLLHPYAPALCMAKNMTKSNSAHKDIFEMEKKYCGFQVSYLYIFEMENIGFFKFHTCILLHLHNLHTMRGRGDRDPHCGSCVFQATPPNTINTEHVINTFSMCATTMESR